MRRLPLFLAFALLVLTLPVLAQDDTIQITFPPPVYDLVGTVDVRGAVNPPDLQSYFLEAAPYDPAIPDAQARWTPVSLPSRSPVTEGVIAQFQTTLLPDGVYRLRLRVVLATGEVRFLVVAPLRISNQLERPEGETVFVPPTAAPEEPTPQPEATTPPRPQVVNELPVPVGGQLADFDEDALEFMRHAGMTWIKWQIPYLVGDDSLVNVARDRINWSHERGFLVLLSVLGTPEQMSEVGMEAYFPQFADFLGRLAELQPDALEVWNEMNIDREWPNGQIDPRSYAEMLRQAYEAIKAVDPQIKVISGALAPTGAEGAFGLAAVWNDDRYYLGMANAGVAQYADCIGVHYNEGIIAPQQQGGDPRDNYPTRYFPLMIQRAAFPFRNSDIPQCYTELGYLSPEGFGQLPSGFAWAQNTSVQEQATWLRDAIQLAAQQTTTEIDLIIVFNINYEHFEEDPQAGYAIIRPDGTCPACDAIRTLRSSQASP